MQDLIDLKNKRVTVMGLGRFGGGVGAVRFLAEQGARVTLTDCLSEEELAESLQQLNGCPLQALHLGGHREDDFVDADMILVNPAVPPDNEYLQLARLKNVPLSSEMNLFWRLNRGRIIGVTGSNGKSTTASMIHAILQADGQQSWLGGNIGGSLLDRLDDIQFDDPVVLELSSFQLEGLDRLCASPPIAVVTNFSPNHLDRHGSLKEYGYAKQTILRWQCPNSIAVLNQDDPQLSHWPAYGHKLWFSTIDTGSQGVFGNRDRVVIRNDTTETTFSLAESLQLPGDHNLHNALAAAAAASAAGADSAAIQLGLANYEPLPHRLQFVAEVAGRRFYNDSLATTPESAIAALEAFDEPIVLLAGGYDKQIDLSLFAERIAHKTKAVSLMGQTADSLADLLDEHDLDNSLSRQECKSLEAAFLWATEHSAPGDVILLSPGCASYDWFNNFAQRGERFVALVNAWQ